MSELGGLLGDAGSIVGRGLGMSAGAMVPGADATGIPEAIGGAVGAKLGNKAGNWAGDKISGNLPQAASPLSSVQFTPM